ncbi:MAG: hypothetical protein LBP50_09340 [Tannerella sp.]|jgi:hypothetical protein|nr:hypothetical protein [Tannerella sp.]
MATKSWFPASRKGRNALIMKTTEFTSVEDNRIQIGFGPATPLGAWYGTTYSPGLIAYDTAYRIWNSPATSTPLALDNLKDAENLFFPVYREFYGTVKASPLVTNAHLEAMGFPPRTSGGRSPHPVDRTFIDLILKPLGNLTLSVGFVNRDTGSSIIPYYLTGAVIYYAVGEAPVSDQNALPHSRLASRSPFELIFNPTERGLTVSLAARWQNRRGELGPWSEIVTAIIP